MIELLEEPRVIHETVEHSDGGAIIFDASVIPSVSVRTFTAAGWRRVRRVEDVLHSGGRGNTLILDDGRQEYVLRHYRRGGLVSRLVSDSYLWLGEDRTRPFAEWRILQKLANAGLPVPRPAVARYCRQGFTYTADIITLRVPGIRSLSALLAGKPVSRRVWRSQRAARRGRADVAA
jgi:3-deoxy-D-manno-octulosonic acid kinase